MALEDWARRLDGRLSRPLSISPSRLGSVDITCKSGEHDSTLLFVGSKFGALGCLGQQVWLSTIIGDNTQPPACSRDWKRNHTRARQRPEGTASIAGGAIDPPTYMHVAVGLEGCLLPM